MAGHRVLFLFLLLLGFGCSKSSQEFHLQSLAVEIPVGIECTGEQHKSVFQLMIELHQDSADDLKEKSLPRQELLERLQDILLKRIEEKSKSSNSNLRKELSQVTAELIVLLDHDLKKLDEDDFETKIARIDYGSQITEEYGEMSVHAHQLLNRATELSKTLGMDCEIPAASPPLPSVKDESQVGSSGIPQADDAAQPRARGSVPTPQSPETNPELAGPADMLSGLRWTMATAYQNCDVLKMDPMNAKTESTQGIQRNSDKGREYKDLGLIQRTHYYLKNLTVAAGCVDVRTKPLVYDYGGAARMKSDKLDMFTNYNGGPALGIDCSAFASTGAATAGLLYVKNSSKRPIYSRWTTRDFVDPVRSGWSCYAKVKVGPQTHLQVGDLAVLSADHMVGVDSLEKDPLGIDAITDIKQCDLISSEKFHFTLIQSAATKGSIGINRFWAADYLKEAAGLKTLFVAYAKAACIARFTGRELLPSTTNTMSIVRHAGTKECKAQRVPLVNESCLRSCGM